MNCKKCGKTIEPDFKFCIHCGESQDLIKTKYKVGNLEPFCQNNIWGYKDKDSREVIVQPKYSSANKFSDKRAVVQFRGKYGILDQNGIEITSFNFDFIFNFSSSFARAKRDNLWAFIDTSGKEITPFKYKNLENFKGDFAKGVLGSFYCLINRKGKEVTQAIYNEIFEFKNNLAIVRIGSNYGLINNQGNQILKSGFTQISLKESGEYIIFQKELQGIYSSSGKEILPCLFSKIILLSDGTYASKKKKVWKSYSNTGKEINIPSTAFKNSVRKIQVKKRRRLFIIIFILAVLSVGCYDYITRDIGIIYKIQLIILGEEETEWRQIRELPNSHPSNPYQTYLNKYPDSKHAEEAKLIIEEDEWQSVSRINKLEFYTRHIDRFPNGKYFDKANEIIEDFKWEKTKSSNSLYAYSSYLRTYPNGKYRHEANDRKSWLETNNWATQDAYKSYLEQFSDGIFVYRAINILISYCHCFRCNGNGKCSQCDGTGIYGREQELISDRCPRASRLFHGNNCRICGGDGRVNERYIWVNKKCSLCIGSGKCSICSGQGFIQNEWLNKWYANKINCENCEASGYIYVNSYNQKVSNNSYDSKRVPCPTCNLLLNKD